MKRQLIYIFAAAAVMLAGCEKQEKGGDKGYGSLRFVCSTDVNIETARMSRTGESTGETTAPAGTDFALTLTGDDYQKSWTTIAEFTAEDPLLKEGDYTATVTYGDPEAEGAGKAYYVGSEQLTIRARKTTEAEITARLGNAQAVVRATQQFLDYYHDIHFTLTTGSGNTFVFDLDAEGYTESPVYVRTGQGLSVAGTARRQSQTGTDQGIEIRFDPVTVAAAEARKRHIFTFDFSEGGGATLKIQIGEDYTEEVTLEFELNDDAKQ